LKLNEKFQLLVYADDVNILGGSVQTVKGNSEALVFAGKENRLEVNVDKTKYMVMSGDQSAGQKQNVKIDNSSIERVEKFKYLGKPVTNQTSTQEEIKSRLKSGNACYHSVLNFCLSVCYTQKKLNTKVHRNVMLRTVLYGCETW
jgi:hypothetical protein